MSKIVAFIRESNLIEGIDREPTAEEIEAAGTFMWLSEISVDAVSRLQAVFAPGNPLRNKASLNVRVGNYIAPIGGPLIVEQLDAIIFDAATTDDPWKVHVAFEMLHPYIDGNGRTGRMLWAWQMHRLGRDPFALSFLHRFYYQTLEHGQ